MFKYIALFLSIILIASLSMASDRVVGHMTPFPSETLDTPVTLDCGASIEEVRGGKLDYAKLNSLCTHAASNFFRFVDAKGLKTGDRSQAFSWSVSFLPGASCYRCLNDEDYRFHNRFVKGYVTGYTDLNSRFSFVISKSRELKVTFVHEMFHAMSMFYGVYENHTGNYSEKTAKDEALAQEFTEWLGYGR